MTKQSWVVSEDRLSVVSTDGISVIMEKPVKLLVALDHLAIILLVESSNQNVIAVDSQGHIIWRIKKHPWATQNSLYTSAWIENGSMVLYNFSGFDLTINPLTGEFLSQEQTR